MSGPAHRLVPAICLAAVWAAGCGGAEDADTAQRSRPTATPATGVDVATVNRARQAFVDACEKREDGDDAAETITALRRSARELIAVYEASPDEEFRRSPNAPEVTMRDTLRSIALIARSRCGGGDAVTVGTRLRRASARGADAS